MASAQTNGGIRTTIFPARDTAALGYVEAYFQRSNLLEAVAQEAQVHLSWPEYVHLAAAQCGARTLPISESPRTVFICYEAVDSLIRGIQRAPGTAAQRHDATAFALTWMVGRELGRAALSVFEPRADYLRANARPGRDGPERYADFFGFMLLYDAWGQDRPLSSLVASVVQNRGMALVPAMTAAAAAVGPAGADSSLSSRRGASVVCWLVERGTWQTRELGPLVDDRDQRCNSEQSSLHLSYHASVMNHINRPPHEPEPHAVRLERWRVPTTTRARLPVEQRDAPRPTGTWTFTERLGRPGQPARCTTNARIRFSAEGGQQRAALQNAELCGTLRPDFYNDDDGTRSGPALLLQSGPVVHFVAEVCAYSGLLSSDATTVRGTVRCDLGQDEDGETLLLTGTWSASSGATAAVNGAAAAEQTATPSASAGSAAARSRFDRFDANGNGYLYGAELDRCDCHAQDANDNSNVSFEEFQRPAGTVVRVFRLEQIAGRTLPTTDPQGLEREELVSARMTLFSTGMVTIRATAREPGGPDMIVTETGRYRLVGDSLFIRMSVREFPAVISGGQFRIRFDSDEPWTLWRQESRAPAQRRRNP